VIKEGITVVTYKDADVATRRHVIIIDEMCHVNDPKRVVIKYHQQGGDE
jgi:hypothetical protein